MRKRYLFFSSLLLIGSGVSSFLTIFSIPKHPQLLTINDEGEEQPLVCYQGHPEQAVDRAGQLNVLVWNIYKQNRDNWAQALTQYSQQADLLFLQEASMTEPLKNWISANNWDGAQANAFRVLGESTGVLNLSKVMPKLACAYTEVEPWLRLPKSGIYAEYPLSNGETLASVNLHAVNFTYGTAEYEAQIERLLERLGHHRGPIILAGDFNSWSSRRMHILTQAFHKIGLEEVSFSPDNRVTFFNGLALDHVFYRGLDLVNAEAPKSDASDHNPLQVAFRLR
ncbi:MULTISPECIES: endonuclease/exonuclease/phosphatase family protein [Vibrio]|uniref:Endonuclease/exonuclease/phosphatase family protein n=2 Tax=Vibrio TaxID=662 RepID=A0A7X4LGT7_9VIBR|nr:MULTISPECIES: endonuclease/exonuclease/phosphatase family protein [Vibrio]MBF8999400.1 endonuclease/exonuclease/phosphatase family protein [Vibrio nitrifigilis]MZI91650.1 endonuclease/exonuclease/phosphatase family protein [Vibrio eleionomae]